MPAQDRQCIRSDSIGYAPDGLPMLDTPTEQLIAGTPKPAITPRKIALNSGWLRTGER
jgi:hypothetical protein